MFAESNADCSKSRNNLGQKARRTNVDFVCRAVIAFGVTIPEMGFDGHFAAVVTADEFDVLAARIAHATRIDDPFFDVYGDLFAVSHAVRIRYQPPPCSVRLGACPRMCPNLV